MTDAIDTAPTGPTQMFEAALAYVRLGWSVIPVHTPDRHGCSCASEDCHSPGKHPRVRWESAMERPATAERIERWWRRWPDANVGVVTGTVSGIAVIDIDPRNGGDASVRSVESRWALLPATAEVRTGGGGTHLWFRTDTETPSGVIAQGVELKADGGMVVVPPSLHASGGRYVWRPGAHPDELPPTQLPEWVVALAGGEVEDVGGDDQGAVPPAEVRTSGEQEDFAAAWRRAGIELLPGDRYYLCPFHDDNHPSLHIDAEGCRWYCFGCGVGGGIGRLLGMLGEDRAPRPRSQLRRQVGRRLPVTLHGDHEVDVVGESQHQDELLELTGGRRRYGGVEAEAVAELVCEPENPVDPDAVGVYIDDRHVGYVRRRDLEWLDPLIEDSNDVHGLASCRALIRGGWDRGRGDVGMFGVTLLLPDPDA